MPPIEGVLLGTTAAGIKYKGRTDLLVAKMVDGTQAAGVFTTSKTASAPVEWCKSSLSDGGEGRMLVVNSGNSNAFTGKAGVATVKATAAAAAQAGNCRQKDVFIASTGVIGQPMDPEPLVKGIDAALGAASADKWDEAARAIMTTDTYPKLATRKVKVGNAEVTINGIAKGSGMIAPDLATMLVFIFTDAAIPAKILQTLLLLGVRDSFNAITVDSDTSTSDTVLVFATGTAMKDEAPITRAGDPRLRDFRAALDDLMLDLSHQVVKDGEGATKFIRIAVSGAQSHQAARRIGMAIANSPLVKTAIAGEDANWGRVVMAVGKSGEAADRDKLSIRIGGIDVAKNGMAVPGYDETPVARHMKGSDIDIEVDVGVGKSSATVWTCDLTYDYIRINADYRS
ncbi:MAG: bifunctional glutamate N-acetyltransferase/amino-acid acetyltransferase ArgJ [Parvibaculum sp.]|nr:bifunctional glutamate N-acetyltransferase/amino-acid acetyltransferase ArgJ [Parvibaculum sp.]MBO6691856.1 bifunctional glutamate N-acetyltransferase/amino-acid acetyltransferase ArgJ [Parvibaculum sp.]MBO6715789.1 bifunctional glutamate N-acetyltransferase/amino-acid acetyltransferase ArgJ [Parvibaculum sp.]